MTDKQIIIDGCDVSGCEHSYISTSLFEEKPYVKCCAFFLENEDSYCDCKDNPNCYYKQLKRKEQECEELKEQCKKYGEINEQETKDYAELKKENEELKQALTEIKEIAEAESYLSPQSTRLLVRKILDKCEVIDETNTNNTL